MQQHSFPLAGSVLPLLRNAPYGQYIERVLKLVRADRPFAALLERLPGQCAVCRGWDRQRICGACLNRFASPAARCTHCALRVPSGIAVCGRCIKNPPPFDGSLAAVDYAYPWDVLISRFKFNNALDLTRVLAARLVDVHRQQGSAAPSLLLPVPLSAERLKERGYNQSWELARQIARQLGGCADGRMLLRIRDTPHQLTLPSAARAANVSGAFAVEPRRRQELEGRDVTLVDDVMTSSATACELTRLLRQAGAQRIQVWVVARTPEPGTLPCNV